MAMTEKEMAALVKPQSTFTTDRCWIGFWLSKKKNGDDRDSLARERGAVWPQDSRHSHLGSIGAILPSKLGIPITNFDETEIDVNIDGADEFDQDVKPHKGGGGAMCERKWWSRLRSKWPSSSDFFQTSSSVGRFLAGRGDRVRRALVATKI